MQSPRFKPTFLTLAILTSFASVASATDTRLERPLSPVEIGQVDAVTQQEVQTFIQRFHDKPSQVIDEIPAKQYKGQGKRLERFEKKDIKNREFVLLKGKARDELKRKGRDTDRPGNRLSEIGRVGTMSAIVLTNDNAAKLVDNGTTMVRSLDTMDAMNLKTASLTTQPWSDDYWAIYRGGLSRRYADAETPNSSNWLDYFTFATQTKPTQNYIIANTTAQLSPAEKYDLLVGDNQFTLKKQMLEDGRYYHEAYGKVETWMGYCHGWAPAAYMLPRPTKAVTVNSVNNTPITFYPSDIKALGTLLWAQNSPGVRFIGSRCNSKNPARDANGRITSQGCFDTNPGTWHQSIVNQIGIAKRSFVFDATFDYEVWNQPVLGYNYIYFNPQTLVTAPTAAGAAIERAAFTKDKFTQYRDPRAVKVVGVGMRVRYMVETSPSTRSTDAPANDGVSSVVYYYDLELDANNNILGGEWYQNAHPDFMWTPTKTAKAVAGTTSNAIWETNGPLPYDWGVNGRATSQNAVPSSQIVNQLFKLSSQ